jgi:hypothetical protein
VPAAIPEREEEIGNRIKVICEMLEETGYVFSTEVHC